jgi:hypothetical protein
MYRIFIFIAFICFFTACKPKAKLVADSAPTSKSLPTISLTKGQCKGLCSKYNISVFGNSMTLQYEGIENVERYGIFERKLTNSEYSTLINAYDKSGFVNLQNQYSVDITDFPMITMTYNNGKVNKKIEGRTERPKVLLDLQMQLERLTTVGEWKTIKEYPINETNDVSNKMYTNGDIIQNQIIIQPKPNISLAPWLRSYEKYGVNLMKKLTADGNTWLISYDMNKIKPSNMIALLRADSSIETAEFNKIISPREH